jgi:hypothetical protein
MDNGKLSAGRHNTYLCMRAATYIRTRLQDDMIVVTNMCIAFFGIVFGAIANMDESCNYLVLLESTYYLLIHVVLTLVFFSESAFWSTYMHAWYY